MTCSCSRRIRHERYPVLLGRRRSRLRASPRAGAPRRASPPTTSASPGSRLAMQRREALVVELDGHVDALGERARRTRASPASGRSPARQRERQADDDAPDLALAHEVARRARSPCASRAAGPARSAWPACRVGSLSAQPQRATPVVQREDPQPPRSNHLRERGLDRRARGGDRLGELLGVATAGLRHRVASASPAAGDRAAALTIAPAFTPRATSAGVTAATRCTRPSTAAPSTVADCSPSLPLMRSATSMSSFAPPAPDDDLRDDVGAGDLGRGRRRAPRRRPRRRRWPTRGLRRLLDALAQLARRPRAAASTPVFSSVAASRALASRGAQLGDRRRAR